MVFNRITELEMSHTIKELEMAANELIIFISKVMLLFKTMQPIQTFCAVSAWQELESGIQQQIKLIK